MNNNKKYALLILLPFVWPLIPASAVADTSARSIFTAHRSAVTQIRILDRASDSKSTIGTGFFISADGYLISNYHVVASAIQEPEKYRAKVRSITGPDGDLDARIIAYDVIHDLALLKVDVRLRKFMRLSAIPISKGEAIFALGNPYDLGSTVIRGTYSGFVENSFHKRIHFSGSLNPGMSGGPSVISNGTVIGINVATAGDDVSFLVPARYAINLINQASHTKPQSLKPFEIIGKQIHSNQQIIADAFKKPPYKMVKIGPYSVPSKLAPFMTCWGNTNEDKKNKRKTTTRICNMQQSIYLNSEYRTGWISIQFTHYTASKLGTFRFANLLQANYNDASTNWPSNSKYYTAPYCRSRFIRHDGQILRSALCIRKHKKLKGIYDLSFVAITPPNGKDALLVEIDFNGISFDNAIKLMRTTLEAIKWKGSST